MMARRGSYNQILSIHHCTDSTDRQVSFGKHHCYSSKDKVESLKFDFLKLRSLIIYCIKIRFETYLVRSHQFWDQKHIRSCKFSLNMSLRTIHDRNYIPPGSSRETEHSARVCTYNQGF